MDKITVYQKPTCTTCREVYAALKESKVPFEAVDYFIEPIPAAKLKELVRKMGIRAVELLRTKEPPFQELKKDAASFSDDEVIDLMARYPELIQRPIVEKGKVAILARPAEKIKEIL